MCKEPGVVMNSMLVCVEEHGPRTLNKWHRLDVHVSTQGKPCASCSVCHSHVLVLSVGHTGDTCFLLSKLTWSLFWQGKNNFPLTECFCQCAPTWYGLRRKIHGVKIIHLCSVVWSLHVNCFHKVVYFSGKAALTWLLSSKIQNQHFTVEGSWSTIVYDQPFYARMFPTHL